MRKPDNHIPQSTIRLFEFLKAKQVNGWVFGYTSREIVDAISSGGITEDVNRLKELGLIETHKIELPGYHPAPIIYKLLKQTFPL